MTAVRMVIMMRSSTVVTIASRGGGGERSTVFRLLDGGRKSPYYRIKSSRCIVYNVQCNHRNSRVSINISLLIVVYCQVLNRPL